MASLLNGNLVNDRLNVLVIGINYAPEPTGSAPYTSGLAEMLSEEGHRVEAYVGIPHYPSWRVLPSDKFRLRYSEQRKGVLVRRFRHFVPGKQTMMRRIAWEMTFYFNALFSKPSRKPDVIIASTPSVSGALLGVYFAKRYRVQLVTVVQDVLGEAVTKSGLKVNSKVGKFVGDLEKLAFRNSTRVCVVSPNFKQYVIKSKLPSNHILDFPNWSHISSPNKTQAEAKSEFGWSEEDFVVLHTGNMGLKQDLGNLIRTAKLFENEPKIRFILCGDGNQKSELKKLAEGVSKIEFMHSVSDEEYPNLLLAADILVVNERDSLGDMSLPSKLTSYLAAGKPILAAISADGACAVELAKTSGAAIIIPAGSPGGLRDAVLELYNSPAKMQQMSSAGSKYAQLELSRSSARERLKRILVDLYH